jgi:hypothetical protein
MENNYGLNRLRKNSESMSNGRKLGDIKPSTAPCGSLLELPGAICFLPFDTKRVFPQPVQPCRELMSIFGL